MSKVTQIGVELGLQSSCALNHCAPLMSLTVINITTEVSLKSEHLRLLGRRKIMEGFLEEVAFDLGLDELLEFKGRASEEILI